MSSRGLGGSEAVGFTIRKDYDSGAVLAHLINYTGGMFRPIDSVVSLDGLRIHVPENVKTARSLVADRELRMEDGFVSLPVLTEFDVILLNLE